MALVLPFQENLPAHGGKMGPEVLTFPVIFQAISTNPLEIASMGVYMYFCLSNLILFGGGITASILTSTNIFICHCAMS